MWSFPNEFYVSRLNVISKRHSKDLAIVVTRRGSCLSARDCCGVCCWLSVTYAVFNRPLSQWLCRREGTFNHPPIIWELMCHTHTLDGSFVFFTQDCSAFFHLMSDFCCVVFCRPSLLVFFRCVGIVVVLSISVFNWFHLRFFPSLVMSLWIWISLESYAFVKFYLFLSKDDNNEIWLWFWFEPFLLFRLILIRAFPDGFDDTYHFLPIFARRHGSFSLFLGV